MNRRGLFCPECHRQLTVANVRLGRCPFCEITICIPKHYLRPAALVGVAAVLVFVVKTYRIMLAPSPSTFTNFVLFILWFVIMFAILFSITRLSSFIQVWLFSPSVKRAYVNYTFTKLRLDDCSLLSLTFTGSNECYRDFATTDVLLLGAASEHLEVRRPFVNHSLGLNIGRTQLLVGELNLEQQQNLGIFYLLDPPQFAGRNDK